MRWIFAGHWWSKKKNIEDRDTGVTVTVSMLPVFTVVSTVRTVLTVKGVIGSDDGSFTTICYEDKGENLFPFCLKTQRFNLRKKLSINLICDMLIICG